MKLPSTTKDELKSGVRVPLSWRGAAAARLTIVGWTVSLIAASLVTTWSVRKAPADTPPVDREIEAARDATLKKLLKNAACPQDPEEIQESVANLFVILNPGLAHRESLKDPEFIETEKAARASFLNPGAVHSKKMKDPEFRRNYEAAMESFTRETRNGKPPIVPSATNAKLIEELRNDPEWRRQREEAVQALLPGVRPSTDGAN